MSYCFNPDCQHPHNPDGAKFCQSCGSKVLLKDRYRAIEILAQSSTGQTFLAVDEDQPSQPRCVVKHFFPQDSASNGLNASVLASRLSDLGKHPHIPELWASFEQDGHQYLVQKYIEGVSLAQELSEAATFSETQIRSLLKDVLPVLQFVHNHLLIHGDIKPENIIRRQLDNRPVLVGFANGTRDASAEFSAPEQIKGQAIASSDIYSLGVTCIHLLTGVSPFDMFDVKADRWVWQDFLKTPVSYQLGKILDKMIERKGADRYQSASEVVRALNAWAIAAPSDRQKKFAFSAAAGAALALFLGTLGHRAPAPVPHTILMPPEPALDFPQSDFTFPEIEQEVQPMRSLVGNTGPFWSVAVSPNGQTLATGSFDGNIQLWNLVSGQQKTTLTAHAGAVWSVAISPDGEMLASGGEDKAVKIWNLRTGELENTLFGHSAAVFSVAFSPDGKTLASVGEDKTVKLWNVRTGNLTRSLHGHTADIQSVTFSPDGKILATGSTDGTVKLWNARTGRLQRTLIGHSEAVWSVAISPDGQTVASGSWDNTVKLWDLHAGQLLNTFTGHSEQVQSVAFSPDGQTLASGDFGGTIKLWQLDTGGLKGTIKGHSAWVEVAFSPTGKTLVSGGFDDTIKLWRLCP